jgi:putative methyltransferase (TIGR04325 family)
MNWRESIKIMIRRLRKNQNMWSGNFANWHSALLKSKGYSSPEILEKVKTAVLKVKNGKAVYERDSVLFDEIEYSWPLVASLMWVAAKNNGILKVLDIGGSLGSSFFQNKKFLNELSRLEWNIVEQENFVVAGREYIEDEKIQFFHSIDECIAKKGKPDILLLACTLPYVEKPYQLINELMSYNVPHILIDNTFFNYDDSDRITIQQVPSSIYPASYPCWFLSYKNILEIIKSKYNIVSEHMNDSEIFLDGRSIPYRGFLGKLI